MSVCSQETLYESLGSTHREKGRKRRVRGKVIGGCIALSLFLSACGGGTSSDGPRLPYRVGDLYGFIDAEGDQVLFPQFDYAMPFSEGQAAINIGGTATNGNMPADGKWGFIDENGVITINPQYDSPPIRSQSYDLHSMSLAMHQGYEFSLNRAAVYTENGQWMYINSKGAPVIRDKNIQSARKFTKRGLAAVYIDRKWGYIDTLGRMVIQPQYTMPVDFEQEFTMVMDKDYNLICIDRIGDPRFEWLRFTEGFYQGYAVAKAKLRGENNTLKNEFQHILVNRLGNNPLTSPPFEGLGRYGNGLVPALVGSKPKELVEYPRQVTLTETRGGKWGFVDTTGHFVINPKYAEARGFSEGLAAVKLTKGSDWGFINTRGAWVVEPGFRRVGFFEEGLCRVTLGLGYNQYFDKTAYINNRGRVVFIQE
ncbi:MAG: WG repeat-containing protein [Bacteroidota bacterium]